ncbi:MAG TPA: hypothetical protein DCS60_08975 [Opitutae bacterium]|nr:hypothetical protein [Opitutae bacterium]
MPKIALIRPRAIGGTPEGWLEMKADNDLVFSSWNSFKVLVVDSPFGSLASSPRVIRDPLLAGPADWILISPKTYIDDAADWILPIIHANTHIAFIQNGVEHLANLRPYVLADRILQVITDCLAERSEPGKILQRGSVLMTIPNTSSSTIASLFPAEGFQIRLTDEWSAAAWRKLCINSGGAVSVLLNQAANLFREGDAADIIKNLIRECIALARVEGAQVEDSIFEKIVIGQSSATEGVMNSIQADLVYKRPIEWDARNGVIVRLGKKHGVATLLMRWQYFFQRLLKRVMPDGSCKPLSSNASLIGTKRRDAQLF